MPAPVEVDRFAGMSRLSRTIAVAFATMMLAAETSAAAPPKRMTVEDFFLDRKSLIGQPVEVDGTYQANGDTVFLVLDKGTNATFIDVDKVARNDRKALYEHCRRECGAVVQGVVAVVPGPFGSDIGIVASSFTLKP